METVLYRAADAFELYNQNDDPQKRKNLILRYSTCAERLKGILPEECAGDLENGVNRAG